MYSAQVRETAPMPHDYAKDAGSGTEHRSTASRSIQRFTRGDSWDISDEVQGVINEEQPSLNEQVTRGSAIRGAGNNGRLFDD